MVFARAARQTHRETERQRDRQRERETALFIVKINGISNALMLIHYKINAIHYKIDVLVLPDASSL